MNSRHLLGVKLTLICPCSHSWQAKLRLPSPAQTFLAKTRHSCVCPKCGRSENIVVIKWEHYRASSDELQDRRRKAKTIKASKWQILAYIRRLGYVRPWQLRDRFGFSDSYASKRLTLLKRQHLVINLLKGNWELTVVGYRRLQYYEKQKGHSQDE